MTRRTTRRFAISLLVAAALVSVLCVTSLWLAIELQVSATCSVGSNVGLAHLVRASDPQDMGWRNHLGPLSCLSHVFAVGWGFEYTSWAMGSSLTVPLWLPFLATLIPGLLLYRRSRHLPNHCPHCRYNLTGLPPHCPCPECGRVYSSTKEAVRN